eukprot:gnl/TRDRNA2_/TRDRNA2_141615_c0_seq1.p1 gnl/TRDRNA2_/TRDRNA2_141615_c0~~gnl/TRDRNA2_/TRDRNA2_141615_c0_seq1.p1  ORF type:complete len:245 (+),score=29.66 gnl/TRDRNA2_/TRDRNA2_141615_c0_seq1:53-736(+)
MVALVGPSGAGKSTTVKLLQRFYDPIMGAVNLDGRDIRDYNLKELRSQFGYVEQEPALFNRSVRDNVLYGLSNSGFEGNWSLEATSEQVNEMESRLIDASTAANAHNFVMELPKQYETLCGERGVRLSGGQKQRLAIARAVVREPRVIIMDEATASLDAESEHLVQEALKTIRRGRTVIVIAHRLSTIKSADNILVFERGCIVERGTHQSLLASGGRYASLVQHQLM